MKRIKSLICLLLLLVLVTGCKKTVVTKCELTNDQSKSNYIIKSNYNIYSEDNIVNKVEIKEVVTSKNNTILSYFEKQLKNNYESYNNTYGGYTYDVSKNNDKVVSNVTIDYSKFSMDKFIKDNETVKNYINKDKKLTLQGVKAMYEATGAKCDKISK